MWLSSSSDLITVNRFGEQFLRDQRMPPDSFPLTSIARCFFDQAYIVFGRPVVSLGDLRAREVPFVYADAMDVSSSMPGAFPGAEDDPPVDRAPKKRFIGRKTLEAQGKLKPSNGSVEDTSAVVPSSKSTVQRVITI